MDTSKLTLKELGKVFGDEICRNCGEIATLDVGCVITGSSPGKCGFCKDLTPEQRVAHAKSNGISVGEPE
jgi:hypothetical protein